MYYELYIDVFFLVNFLIDFISLCVLKKILKLSGNIYRRILGAVCGGLLLCLYFIFDLRFIQLGYYALVMITGPLMLIISFKHKSFNAFLKALIFLVVIILVFNGCFNLFAQKIQYSYQLLWASVVLYVIFLVTKRLFLNRNIKEDKICRVRFIFNGNEFEGTGLIDTGNCLKSPYHNRGISVAEYELFEQYLSEFAKEYILSFYNEENINMQFFSGEEKIFVVPYKTISTPHGILPVLTVDKLFINTDDEEKEYTRALVGLIKDKVSVKGDINVILSTNI